MTRGRKSDGASETGAENTEAATEATAARDSGSGELEWVEGLAADLDRREAELATREAELATREADLAPREREHTQLNRTRSADDTHRMERMSLDFYKPPNQLEVPSDGQNHYRWAAEYVNGSHTPNQVNDRLREGYVRVTKESLPEDFLVDEDDRGDGFARMSGLILMRIPVERKMARDAYYQKRSQQRLLSADELQGVAGSSAVREDRGSRSLTGAEAGRALKQMTTS